MTARNEETARAMHDDDIRATLCRVLEETQRQVAKWGIQHHPDGTGDDYVQGAAAIADSYRATCDLAAAAGELTWRHIALEEFFEGLAEPSNSEALEVELIQAAAVLVSWATDLHNRRV